MPFTFLTMQLCTMLLMSVNVCTYATVIHLINAVNYAL
jgi:hypothetical protein